MDDQGRGDGSLADDRGPGTVVARDEAGGPGWWDRDRVEQYVTREAEWTSEPWGDDEYRVRITVPTKYGMLNLGTPLPAKDLTYEHLLETMAYLKGYMCSLLG